MDLQLATKVESAYSSPPWWYDLRGFLILKTSYRGSLLEQVAFFERNVRERHLEVAIGSGTLYSMVQTWRRWKGGAASQVVGVDYSEKMLGGARQRFRQQPEIELLQGDVTDLPFGDGTFESINVANAFHCFADADAALESMCRVLAPGGTLAMNVLLYPRGWQPFRWLSEKVNRWGIRKGILHTPYQEEDVRGLLLACGLTITQERVRGNCYFVVARKPQ